MSRFATAPLPVYVNGLFLIRFPTKLLTNKMNVPMTAKDLIGVISDYPPAIRKRCVELGLTIASLSDRRIGDHASGMIFKMAEALEKSKVFFYT